MVALEIHSRWLAAQKWDNGPRPAHAILVASSETFGRVLHADIDVLVKTRARRRESDSLVILYLSKTERVLWPVSRMAIRFWRHLTL